MEIIIKLIRLTDKLARLKEHDPETYVTLVNHCMLLGIVVGSFGTLWIVALAALLITV